jgi:hypothetical protein
MDEANTTPTFRVSLRDRATLSLAPRDSENRSLFRMFEAKTKSAAMRKLWSYLRDHSNVTRDEVVVHFSPSSSVPVAWATVDFDMNSRWMSPRWAREAVAAELEANR